MSMCVASCSNENDYLRIVKEWAGMGFLVSCTSKKNVDSGKTAGVEFPDSVNISWNYLAGDGYVPTAFEDIAINDSCIYILGLNYGHWIHIFDARTGAYMGMRVTRGGDEGQLENASRLRIVKGRQEFSIYDYKYNYRQDVKYYSKDFEFERTFNVDSLFRNDHGIYDLSHGRALVAAPVFGKNGRATGRIAQHLIDVNTKRVLSTYDGKEPFDTIRASIYRVYSIAPSLDRVATVQNYGGALEIYRISGDSICRTFVKNYFPVDYIYYEGREFPDINREIQYGFRWVAATDDYIYASYCDSKEVQPLVTTIGVWDWDGNPVKKIKTDRNIWNMAASPDGRRLYCISPVAGTSPQLCYIDL